MAPELQSFYEFGPFRLLIQDKLLLRGGQLLPLKPKAFDLLRVLVENHGRVVDKETLLQQVWPGTFVQEDNITYNISMVRKALGDGVNGERYIETIPRRGYRFVAAVNGLYLEAGRMSAPPASPEGVASGDSADVLAADAGRTQVAVSTGWRRRVWLSTAVCAGLAACVAVYMATKALLLPPTITETRRLTYAGQDSLMLTDGIRVYFRENTGAQSLFLSVSVDGGDTAPVRPPLPNVAPSDLSPDHSEFLGLMVDTPQQSTSAIVTWPVAGGPVKFVGGLRGNSPKWSPDKTRIAYSGKNQVFVAGSNGEGERVVATAPGEATEPHWSPDGKLLRFLVTAAGAAPVLWEVPATDGKARPVFPGWSRWPDHEAPGVWTPDGRNYVFPAIRNGRSDLWVRREKCGPLFLLCRKPNPVRLTQGPVAYGVVISSPNGKQLFALGSQDGSDLARFDLASRSLQTYFSGLNASEMDFSRDGQWVAYTTEPDHALWRSRPDGSEPLRLRAPRETLEARAPHWSPDGKKIAFMALVQGDRRKLCLVSSDGSSPQFLIPDPGSQEGVPTWSKDGTQIVFGEPLYRNEASEMSIHLFDLKTRSGSPLLNSHGLWTARWSPDGRYIAALAVERMPGGEWDSNELRLFDWNAKRWSTLFRMDRIEDPAWSNDSRHIYFHTLGEDPGEYRASVPGGHVELLTSLKHVRRSEGSWTGVAPDGSPLIMRNKAMIEIYALDMKWP
jgi:Tol biopolymer transport system component/DNA-binding winged helix-turn-helix (wHTH) protein